MAPNMRLGLIPARISYAAAILTMTAQRVAIDFVSGFSHRLSLLQADAGWPYRQFAASAVTSSPASGSMAGRVLWAAQTCRVLLVQQGLPHLEGDIPVLYTPQPPAAPTIPRPEPGLRWILTPGDISVPVLISDLAIAPRTRHAPCTLSGLLRSLEAPLDAGPHPPHFVQGSDPLHHYPLQP